MPIQIEPWIRARFPNDVITPLTEGWSDDQKLRVEGAAGSLLMRLSPAETLARKRDEFAQVDRLNQRSVAFPHAVECGLSPDGAKACVLYTWLTGAEALSVLPGLSDEAQFALGLQAGRLLKEVHSMPQERIVNAYDYVSAKVAQRRRQISELGLEFDGYAAMVGFLERHLPLLRGAPTVFRHGDFHLGNMLVTDAGELRVIDFNRSDFGDPMEDFNRLFTFSRKSSPAFARGQIMGYLGEEPGAEFFAHALCYVMVDCAFGLLWARRFGQREIDVHFSLVKQVMDDFDQLRTLRPRWF
ncbi:MAG: aminoglycoside phosphotransferase family protein [Rariglobus sp.]